MAIGQSSPQSAILPTAGTTSLGGVKVDGSTITINGSGVISSSGGGGTADTLTTARTIGGVSFDGSANINLPGVNAVGNQNTTGSAATLTTARRSEVYHSMVV